MISEVSCDTKDVLKYIKMQNNDFKLEYFKGFQNKNIKYQHQTFEQFLIYYYTLIQKIKSYIWLTANLTF